MTNDTERYARQLALRDFGKPRQQSLLRSRVLLVGAGGLGSPAATYLAAAGIGHLVINDCDSVHLSNLHRQTLYDDSDIGARKARAAETRLRQVNSAVQVRSVDERLDSDALAELIGEADIVLDCTDNFATRQRINAGCIYHAKTLVSGAAAGMDGQVSVFACDRSGPCYQCFLDTVGDDLGDCEGAGILGPVTGIIGSLMAIEAIKSLTGYGKALAGRLVVYDALNAEWKTLALGRNPRCITCGDVG